MSPPRLHPASVAANRDALALYRRIASLLPVAVIMTDAQGRILEANPAAAACIGLPVERLLGQDLHSLPWDVLRPDGTAMPARELPGRIALSQGIACGPTELGLRRADGTIVWLRLSAAPVPLPGYGVVLVAQDETARLESLTALEARDRRHRLAVESGGLGVWELDLPGRTLHLDPNLKQMLGYSPEELPSTLEAWLACMHPEDREQLIAKARDCLAGARDFFEDEHRMLHKSGQSVWFLTRGVALRDESGAPLAMYGTHVNITHLKRVREVVAQTVSRSRSITDNLPLGLAVIDERRRIIMANPTLRQWYAHVEFDAFPSCRKLLPPDAPPCSPADCHCFPAEDSSVPNELQLEVPLPQGRRTLRFAFCPMHQAGATQREVILLLEDVTEKLVVEARLHRARKLEAMGTLAAGIAHEINQPLNALQLYGTGLDMLLDNNPSLPVATIRERLHLMLQETNKVRDLIHHMRALSRPDAPASIQPVDVAASVQSALRLVHAQLAAHGVTLTVQLPQDLPRALASPVQLEQVVLNLVVNAMEALDTLPADPQRPKSIRLEGVLVEAGEGQEGQVLLRVEDNGPGLSHDQDRLFDPFFTTKGGGPGMGLGLSIVHTMARSWGAEVVVESLPDAGARFTLALRTAGAS